MSEVSKKETNLITFNKCLFIATSTIKVTKGNLTLKSNLNIIMLCGDEGQYFLVFLKIFQRYHFIFTYLYNILSELNNIFHMKGLIRQ